MTDAVKQSRSDLEVDERTPEEILADATMVAFEDFIAIPINKAIKLMVTMTKDFKSN